MAAYAADKDQDFPLEAEQGNPLGVEEDIVVPEGVLRPKLPNEEVDEPFGTVPHSEPNYLSAEAGNNAAFLKAQYDEDVGEGMALGPYSTDEELAATINTAPADICYGALAVRDEVDAEGNTKKRTLQSDERT